MSEPLQPHVPPEQMRYAAVLGAGVRGSFMLLLLTFALYAGGVLAPLVPLEQLPSYWSLSARDFARATGTPTGWGWIGSLGRGDLLNLAGIALLACMSAAASLAVLPIFLRRRDVVAAALLVLQLAVLVVSAACVPDALH
jgi:hypothetical protein